MLLVLHCSSWHFLKLFTGRQQKVLQYVKGTLHYGLMYVDNDNFKLIGHTKCRSSSYKILSFPKKPPPLPIWITSIEFLKITTSKILGKITVSWFTFTKVQNYFYKILLQNKGNNFKIKSPKFYPSFGRKPSIFHRENKVLLLSGNKLLWSNFIYNNFLCHFVHLATEWSNKRSDKRSL